MTGRIRLFPPRLSQERVRERWYRSGTLCNPRVRGRPNCRSRPSVAAVAQIFFPLHILHGNYDATSCAGNRSRRDNHCALCTAEGRNLSDSKAAPQGNSSGHSCPHSCSGPAREFVWIRIVKRTQGSRRDLKSAGESGTTSGGELRMHR